MFMSTQRQRTESDSLPAQCAVFRLRILLWLLECLDFSGTQVYPNPFATLGGTCGFKLLPKK